MCTNTSVYVGPLWVHRPHTLCYLRREYLFWTFFLSFHVTAVYGRNQQRRGIAMNTAAAETVATTVGRCGQCVLPTVRRSLIVHLFRRLHSESLKHTSNGDTHRYTAAYDM